MENGDEATLNPILCLKSFTCKALKFLGAFSYYSTFFIPIENLSDMIVLPRKSGTDETNHDLRNSVEKRQNRRFGGARYWAGLSCHRHGVSAKTLQ